MLGPNQDSWKTLIVNNVPSTHTSTACYQLSRHNLLAWVNATLQSQFTKVDELCTGAAYCQLMDLLFPAMVPLRRVKFYTNVENEFIDNFKILQMIFLKLDVQKAIPVDRLVRGKFQDNIEFLQWFKRFFDVNYEPRVYDPIAARHGQAMGYGTGPLKRKPPKPAMNRPKINEQPQLTARTYVKAVESPNDDDKHKQKLQRSLTRTELRHDLTAKGATSAYHPSLILPNADLTLIKLADGVRDVSLATLKAENQRREWNTMELKLTRIVGYCEQAKAVGQLAVDVDTLMHIILGKAEIDNGDDLAQRPLLGAAGDAHYDDAKGFLVHRH